LEPPGAAHACDWEPHAAPSLWHPDRSRKHERQSYRRIERMLTLFGYSLVALTLVLFVGRNLSRKTRLMLSLVTLILLNGPTLLTLLFYT